MERITTPKQVLSIKVNRSLYQRLKKEVGNGKVSRFIEGIVSRELDEQEAKKVAQEKKEFQKKLIADYKRDASSKTLRKEDEI